jgi:large repetitive protein
MHAATPHLRLALLAVLVAAVAAFAPAAAPSGGGPPVAVDDALNTARGTPGDVDVLANDSDPDGDPLSIPSWTQGAEGTVVCTGSVCSYTPDDPGFVGVDSFDYTVADGNGGTDVGTVLVDVTYTNAQPVAGDDILTTDEDEAGQVDVLANDEDEDGDQLTVVTETPDADHGTVSCTPEGLCTYTPSPDFNGSDSFTYTIEDGAGADDAGEVTVTVTPVNDDPNAVADSFVVTENEQGSLNVLGNDTDIDGDALSVSTSAPAATHGTVSCQAAGLCTYTPDPDFEGSDSFQYQVTDGQGGSDSATVSVTVTPENSPPVADDETLTTAEDTAGSVNVLVGDTDADGDLLSVTTPAPAAANGTVSCTAGGSCTYTPEAHWHGDDSFDYTVADGRGGSDTGTVTVTVTSVNDAPVAVDDSLTVAEDAQAQVDVLLNDSDVEGDALSVTGSTNGAHGAVSCLPDGTCTYVPVADYAGADTFTYTVSDGVGGTDTGTVSVDVSPVNDAPVADDDVLTTQMDTPADVNVLAGDVDVDGDSLAVEAGSWSDPEHGSADCNEATGVCTYTPDAGYVGPDSFTYTVTDGLATDEGLVSVTVDELNVQPSCANVKPSEKKLWPPEHQLVLVKLSGATDSDGDPLAFTITAVTQDEKVKKVSGKGDKKPDARRVSGKPDRIRLRAERDPDKNGRVYRIAYRVSDGHGGSCTGVEKVGVPVKKRKDPVENTKSYNSFG